mmetsp:Transcript_15910/g.44011  ORF Transcript_15910/g.44011 Transcript_15910/m.44011 type:complete len:215 (+) Transcript_15910:1033-1677(+)
MRFLLTPDIRLEVAIASGILEFEKLQYETIPSTNALAPSQASISAHIPFRFFSHKSINSSTVGRGFSVCCLPKFKHIGAHSFPRNPRICFLTSHGSFQSDSGWEPNDVDKQDFGTPPNRAISIALSASVSVSRRVPSISKRIALILVASFEVRFSSTIEAVILQEFECLMLFAFFACESDNDARLVRPQKGTNRGDKPTKLITLTDKSEGYIRI